MSPKFFKLPKQTILEALYCWHLGDGWESFDNGGKAHRLYCSTSSKKLVRQCWYVLNSLGIRCRIQTVKSRPGGVIKGKVINSNSDSYCISIGDKVAVAAFKNRTPTNIINYYKRIELVDNITYEIFENLLRVAG